MKIFAISGLGADQRVFKYLTLDHELVPVEWIEPIKNEPIIEYSKRLVQEYKINQAHEFGIIGVSFGGLIATEISTLTKPSVTILVSSVETRAELSSVIKCVGKSKVLELIPEKWFKPPSAIAHFMFGTENKDLLDAILKDTSLSFTKWALRELMNWRNQTRLKHLIKIGGAKDKLLPPKGGNTILIEKGQHFMIVDEAKKISDIMNAKIKSMKAT